MASLKERIKEILLRDKILEPKDLEWALEEQKNTGAELSKILVDLKLVQEDTLNQILSESLGLPQINVARLQIDSSVVKLIPKNLAEKYKLIPVSLMGENLSIAMSDPLNIFAIDNLKTLTGYTINPIIGKVKDIDTAIQKYYYEAQEGVEETSAKFDEIIKDIEIEEKLELIREVEAAEDRHSIEELTEEAPIIRLCDTIIHQAVTAKASDVFIEPMEKTVRVRYRIDGVIREIDRMAKVIHLPLVSRIKVICNLDISEHRLPQDGRFKTIIAGSKEVDFRVNVLPTAMGEKVVLRVLDKEGSVLDIQRLGFDTDSLKRLQGCYSKPHGMILACGPTGSGKTTTLYSILKSLDTPEKNIVTVEDPVEYQVKGINQVNVKPNVGLTFTSSLRSILRQDPDIIMIGEIRDAETLDIAVKAALTGHLVLSSLHTTTAAGSIVRMENMGIAPFLICSSVLAIVAQRLIRKVCPHCKETYTVPSPVAEKVGLAKLYPKQNKFEFFRAKGCDKCFRLGYAGRVVISEVLIFSLKIKDFVLNRGGEFKIKEAARREGMKTMREDGLQKAFEGITTLEEVLRVTAPDEDVK